MTFNFLGPGLTVNVEAKVKEQIILDSSESYRCFRITCWKTTGDSYGSECDPSNRRFWCKCYVPSRS